jgi:hypothetical protein
MPVRVAKVACWFAFCLILLQEVIMGLGSIMEMVGMVDVVLVAEVVAVQGAVLSGAEDEATAVNPVDTMTMVNQRHHLPKDEVSM